MKFNVSQISTAEIMSPVFFAAWGIWFLLFDVTGSTVSYEKGRFFSNYEWSLVFTLVACFRAVSAVSLSKRVRFWSIVTAAALWFVMFLIFAFSNFYSHAVPTVFLFAVLNLMSLKETQTSQENGL